VGNAEASGEASNLANAGSVDNQAAGKMLLAANFIDISKMLPGNQYSDRVKVTHNGQAITCAGTQGYFKHAGKDWKLLQYQFHTPSER